MVSQIALIAAMAGAAVAFSNTTVSSYSTTTATITDTVCEDNECHVTTLTTTYCPEETTTLTDTECSEECHHNSTTPVVPTHKPTPTPTKTTEVTLTYTGAADKVVYQAGLAVAAGAVAMLI